MSSKKKIKERTKARQQAISLLYSSAMVNTPALDILEKGLYPSSDLEISEYAEELVVGTQQHLDDIDTRIAHISQNWTLERMPLVDLAILRVAVYEMVYCSDVPVSVAISEAVEVAKSFGAEDESSRFINGVLGKIACALDEENKAFTPQADERQTDERQADEHQTNECHADERPADEHQADKCQTNER